MGLKKEEQLTGLNFGRTMPGAAGRSNATLFS